MVEAKIPTIFWDSSVCAPEFLVLFFYPHRTHGLYNNVSLFRTRFSKTISKNKGSYWQEILSACQCVTVLSLAEGLVDILALLHCYGSVGSKTSNAPAPHLTPLQSSHAEAKQKILKNSLGHNYCWNSQPFPNVLYDPQWLSSVWPDRNLLWPEFSWEYLFKTM